MTVQSINLILATAQEREEKKNSKKFHLKDKSKIPCSTNKSTFIRRLGLVFQTAYIHHKDLHPLKTLQY